MVHIIHQCMLYTTNYSKLQYIRYILFIHFRASKTDGSSSLKSESLVQECMVCTEHMACIKFMPCGHVIACYDCCQKMKRCLHCKTAIESKTWSGKQTISVKEKEKYSGTCAIQHLSFQQSNKNLWYQRISYN